MWGEHAATQRSGGHVTNRLFADKPGAVHPGREREQPESTPACRRLTGGCVLAFCMLKLVAIGVLASVSFAYPGPWGWRGGKPSPSLIRPPNRVFQTIDRQG
jgi:hypothetical protein